MDPEITAMNEAWEAISPLPADAQARVIRYLAGRASMDAAGDAEGVAAREAQPEFNFYGKTSRETKAAMADRLRALFADRTIDTTANKILVAASMIQKDLGGRPVSAREIHEPLRKAGVSITNISAHLNAIHERSGRKMIIKVTEKNRHHHYQVTTTGQQAVKTLIGEPDS